MKSAYLAHWYPERYYSVLITELQYCTNTAYYYVSAYLDIAHMSSKQVQLSQRTEM